MMQLLPWSTFVTVVRMVLYAAGICAWYLGFVLAVVSAVCCIAALASWLWHWATLRLDTVPALCSPPAAAAADQQQQPQQQHRKPTTRCVITGAAGFVGSHLVLAAAQQYDEVVALDIVPPRTTEGAGGTVQPVVCDVCDQEALSRAFAGAQVVFHVAALVDTRSTVIHKRRIHRVNVVGTACVANACVLAGVTRLVLLSSIGAVLDGRTLPKAHCNEAAYDSGLGRHISTYGSTKHAAELIVLGANGAPVASRGGGGGHGGGGGGSTGCRLRTAALRPHVIWGPGDPIATQLFVGSATPPPSLATPANAVYHAIYVKNLCTDLLETAAALDDPTRTAAVAGRAFFVKDATLDKRVFERHLVSCRADAAPMPGLLPLFVVRTMARVLQLIDTATAGRAFARMPELRLLTPETIRYACMSTPIDTTAFAAAVGRQRRLSLHQALAEVQAHFSPLAAAGSVRAEEPLSTRHALRRLLSPVTVRGLTLRNRVIKAATFEAMSADGAPGEELARHHATYARGGVGLTVVSYGAVCLDGRTFKSQMVVDSKAMPGLRRVAKAVHAAGGAVCLQLNHAGYFADRAVCGGVNYGASSIFNPVTLNWPRAMTEADIMRVANAFARAASVAVAAGFDSVQVHCAHGYLLSQFLSPFTNRRSDKYGGSLENRLRFPLRVLKLVRVAIGPDVPLVVKMNVSDGFRGGLSHKEAMECAQAFAGHGADIILPSGGFVTRAGLWMLRGRPPVGAMAAAAHGVKRLLLRVLGNHMLPDNPFGEGFLRPAARCVAARVEGTQASVALLGGVSDLNTMACAMAQGFGFVAVARALLREPDLLHKYERTVEALERGAAASATVRDCIDGPCDVDGAVQLLEADGHSVRTASLCDHCNLCIVGSTMAETPLRCVRRDKPHEDLEDLGVLLKTRFN